jgi:hypothetical protein
MTSPDVPRNAYTDAPEQRPNLILGSLQLLFWIFFRPSAWRNHLIRINPDLNRKSPSWSHLRWRNWALWKLLIQGYLLLPLLFNLPFSFFLILLGLGESIEIFVLCILISLAFSAAFGVAVSVALSVAFSLTFGIAFGIAFGVMVSVAFGVAFNLAWVVACATTSILAVCLLICRFINVPIGTVTSQVVRAAGSLAIVLRPILKLLRLLVISPFLKVGNHLLYILDKRRTGINPSLLRWNSAFWDEWQHQPLYNLDKHLILVTERNPPEGRAAIEYLSTRPQRWAAQAAQIEMDIRELEHSDSLEAIRKAHESGERLFTGELEGPVSSLLRSFSRISENVDAALNHGSTYNQRLALSDVAENLNRLSRELTTSNNEYAVRLQGTTLNWRQIVTEYLDELAEAVELRQEIDSPYIIGVPLTEQQEIFVGRTDISLRIEQLLLDRRRPPLLLYGQRRMGKTSLLNNLGRLLPNSIVPLFVDLQGPASRANDHAGFLYNIARGMRDSAQRQGSLTLPSLTREALVADPFTCFDEWLDDVEKALENSTVLLELDEFEALDNALKEGRFSEMAVLGMLRNLIQHRPRFKVLLSGSHTIEEFQCWASYLINVQVVHISYLNEDEARQLIERPVKDFALRYEPHAVQRVLKLTHCHPYLVQLLCQEIVFLKNEQYPNRRRLATLYDVEAAVPEALSSGSLFFADIQNNQVEAAGLAVLRFLAAQGEGAIVTKETLSSQFPDRLDSTLNLLLRRELIEQVGDRYRFQVELIRRWFAQPR